MESNKDNNRLAAVEAMLSDFALKMQELQTAQARTDKQIAQTEFLFLVSYLKLKQ